LTSTQTVLMSGNHENIGVVPGLNELSADHILLNDQAANRRLLREPQKRRAFTRCIGIG